MIRGHFRNIFFYPTFQKIATPPQVSKNRIKHEEFLSTFSKTFAEYDEAKRLKTQLLHLRPRRELWILFYKSLIT